MFARRLKLTSKPGFEKYPSVFPVVVGRMIIGTAFVFQTQDSGSFVVSWSSQDQSTCRMIVNRNNKIEVHSITLRHKDPAGATVAGGSSQNLRTQTLPKLPGGVQPFEAVPSDGDQTGSMFYMAARRTVHGCNNKNGMLPTRTSKICKVKRCEDGSYVRRRGRRFKSFPLGAPLVNDKNQLVGVITAVKKKWVTGVLSVTELENLVKD